jgi:hypothetical protein
MDNDYFLCFVKGEMQTKEKKKKIISKKCPSFILLATHTTDGVNRNIFVL